MKHGERHFRSLAYERNSYTPLTLREILTELCAEACKSGAELTSLLHALRRWRDVERPMLRFLAGYGSG
jgi:hypothetical protein